jgi:hypothetical protein
VLVVLLDRLTNVSETVGRNSEGAIVDVHCCDLVRQPLTAAVSRSQGARSASQSLAGFRKTMMCWRGRSNLSKRNRHERNPALHPRSSTATAAFVTVTVIVTTARTNWQIQKVLKERGS